MTRRLSVVLAVSALWLASCATTPRSSRRQAEPPTGGVAHTVAHPREVTFSAIQQYMAQRQWPLAETNLKSGLIRSGRFHLDAGRDYAHCTSGRRSAYTGYDAELEIWVRRLTANGTTVTVSSKISAQSDAGNNSDCSTTGALEDELVAGIDSVIAARGH
jgi:hypothetical protein